MRLTTLMIPLAACATSEQPPVEPVELTSDDYLSADILRMDAELVSVFAGTTQDADEEAISAYADCVVAQYAMDQGFGYVRPIRTTYSQEGGIRYGDAVYTLSETEPKGEPIDASATVIDCAAQGIPTAGKGQA